MVPCVLVFSPHFWFLLDSGLERNFILGSLGCFQVLTTGVWRPVTLVDGGRNPVLGGGVGGQEASCLCTTDHALSPSLEKHVFQVETSGSFAGR